MNDNDRALCAATAHLLRASGTVAVWGLALTAISLAVLALTGRSLSLLSCMGFGAVAVIGVLERYLDLRVRFDAGLFDDVGRGTVASLAALDSALQRLGLRPAVRGVTRQLDDRVLGARQLLQRHTLAVACQSAMFLLALLTQDSR
jgi:hypothetical protein